jgi:peroxiredoxin
MDDEASKRCPVSTPIEPSAETLSGFRTLDIRTDRLLSSWLREAGVPDGALKTNELAPDFLLPEANGRLVSSLELRQTAPLIVTFVYGTWSPLCAAGLRALHGATPSIRAAGARAIAITPETGDLPRNFKRDHRLDLEILSDLDLGVSLSFGLVSVVPAEIKCRLLRAALISPLAMVSPFGCCQCRPPMSSTNEGSSVERVSGRTPSRKRRQQPCLPPCPNWMGLSLALRA